MVPIITINTWQKQTNTQKCTYKYLAMSSHTTINATTEIMYTLSTNLAAIKSKHAKKAGSCTR